jgi:hypothetical protein
MRPPSRADWPPGSRRVTRSNHDYASMTDQSLAAKSSERLAEKLTSEGKRSLDFFRSLLPSEWEQVVYSDGIQWKVRQVLAHFVSSEAANALVVENIVAGGPGAPLDFEINKFNTEKVDELARLTDEALLEKFELLRQATADLVRRLDASDLVKEGRHPFFGIASVEDIIKLIYRHNQIHLRDVRRRFGS